MVENQISILEERLEITDVHGKDIETEAIRKNVIEAKDVLT